MRPFPFVLTLLQVTAWLVAKNTTDGIGAAQTRQVNDAAAAKAIHDVISGKGVEQRAPAQAPADPAPLPHAAPPLTADEELQRKISAITVQRGSLNAKQTRRLQASCAAGQAVMPDGVSCGTTIDGCRAGAAPLLGARAGREVAGSD